MKNWSKSTSRLLIKHQWQSINVCKGIMEQSTARRIFCGGIVTKVRYIWGTDRLCEAGFMWGPAYSWITPLQAGGATRTVNHSGVRDNRQTDRQMDRQEHSENAALPNLYDCAAGMNTLCALFQPHYCLETIVVVYFIFYKQNNKCEVNPL